MSKVLSFPDYVFESSWEVCNKVGGIYTVLSTRAKTLQDALPDKIIFIGPDCWHDKECPYFMEDTTLLAEWRKVAECEGLKVKVGRWTIPGRPIAILVDFEQYYAQRDIIYFNAWQGFQVDSMKGYGDYDEANMFSYAAALVVESLYNFLKLNDKKVIYQGNEWMTCMGLLYVKKHLPQVGTIFTTHATSIGRSIAGNNKPLYEYLWAYNGTQMADELNMTAKHSLERQTAHYVDCFTTVSEITARECRELLDKQCDVVLPNGFEDDFVPKGAAFDEARKRARNTMLRLANCLTGCEFGEDTLLVGTGGRYEFRNKGIDVFVEAVNKLRFDCNLHKQVVAFVEVPGWVGECRQDLKERMESGKTYTTPLEMPMVTHNLRNVNDDRVLNMMRNCDMWNRPEDSVKVIFVPCYLDGREGIINQTYYNILIGKDLTVYPSYYEPWGYTPLESIAFKVPCITTDLAGFGLWANSVKGNYSDLADGVKTIHRTDYNYHEVAEAIKNTIVRFSAMTEAEVEQVRANAFALSKKALWSEFIRYYYEAYDKALKH